MAFIGSTCTALPGWRPLCGFAAAPRGKTWQILPATSLDAILLKKKGCTRVSMTERATFACT